MQGARCMPVLKPASLSPTGCKDPRGRATASVFPRVRHTQGVGGRAPGTDCTFKGSYELILNQAGAGQRGQGAADPQRPGSSPQGYSGGGGCGGGGAPGAAHLVFLPLPAQEARLELAVEGPAVRFYLPGERCSQSEQGIVPAANKHRLTTPQGRANGPPGDLALGTLSTWPGKQKRWPLQPPSPRSSPGA